MDYSQLDESLKLLNGLHNNPSKRNEIISSIKKNKRISIFAYGSLLWKPIEHIDEMISNCVLPDYQKGFYCEDFVYRGTLDFKGLTMGLIKQSSSFVHGALFVAFNEEIIPFIKSFVKRETPVHYNQTIMNIYTYDFVKITLPDRNTTEYALTCVVNSQSLFYLKEHLTLEEQSLRIGQAYGINGTNFQYLDKLVDVYRQLKIQDTFTDILQDLHMKVLLYRQSLTLNVQKWYQIYDQLQTLEQRKEATKAITIIQPFLYHSDYLEDVNKQTNQEVTVVE
ncbi:unnamed protein product [Adineta ricciae]|uniref:glutathione-specific gamma-glutamylcyclotransferase n=1 Tax=Adineta ricciae TaxID=249248 RepID=A0A813PEQ3_ADIRI|nr:unnamed protein product [Adineta ricciae]CAF1191294.1 unnamed protein product [Adineta ricciae]